MTIRELKYLMQLVEKYGYRKGITVDTPVGELKRLLGGVV